MTVTSEANRWQSSGNGVTTAFSVGKVFDDDELVVYLLDTDDVPDLQVKTTDYTVSGILTNTVVVTFLVAPPSGYTVVIYRDFALTQTTDIKNQGSYDPEIHEDRFDRLTLQIQTMRAELDRALRLPMTDITGGDMELPTPVDGMVLGWNSDGDIINAAIDTDFVAAATTTVPGVVELSLDVEAQGKSGGTVITAGNLAALESSESFSGFAERANTSEANTGTDDVRYMTPLKTRGSLGPSILAATAKTTPVANDILAILDSAASNQLKRSTIQQLITGLSLFSGFNIQAITATGTYTPTSGMKYCLVISTGGGGGGGGADTDGNSGIVGVAAGGSAGATCFEFFTAAQIGASQSVTIGAAGAAGSLTGGTTGGNGGDTTFGALHTAGGGLGGTGSGVAATGSPETPGLAGGTATGGTVNILGGGSGGGAGFSVDGTTDVVYGRSGAGGDSWWGGGGSGAAGSVGTLTADLDIAGLDGQAFGSGGGGAISLTSTTGASGGAGKIGICVIFEFI